MSKENTRNVIILKNLPSNLIAEAILVVKDKKQVADYMKESEFGANKDVSNCKTPPSPGRPFPETPSWRRSRRPC